MGQYRPEYEVGQVAQDGSTKYAELDRSPTAAEMRAAFEAARAAGLTRLDERRPHPRLLARLR